MDLKRKYGKTALVAGASEGIGAAFAIFLAKEGMDLVLIARRSEPLQQLADSMENRYKVNVTCISCDLAGISATQNIQEALDGKEISLLVYNAALSYIGPFIKNSEVYHSQMVQVNMITPLKMLHVFGEKCSQKGRGQLF